MVDDSRRWVRLGLTCVSATPASGHHAGDRPPQQSSVTVSDGPVVAGINPVRTRARLAHVA
jgi:hypothetical protein